MTINRSRNEYIKEESRQLRGTIADGLDQQVTGALSDDDQQLVKFHGTYLQDDRDVRSERTRKKLEKAYSFMIRVRIPGGVVSPAQWLALDKIAGDYANGTLRLTTRQTFQFHGVLKSNMRSTMRAINAALLDTIAACGDVNRNVLATSNPHLSEAHEKALDLARALSAHLLPRTGAYHEIWLDGEKVVESQGAITEEEEPIYRQHYLPRKFKVVVAVPPDNDVDVFAQDLGFIAIVESGKLAGWNIAVGGGMGMTHGDPETFPRTADVLGFCPPGDAIAFAEAILTVQRDWGNRDNRKRARLKYTIEDRGLDVFRDEVETRAGVKLGEARAFSFERTGDHLGWRKGPNNRWHLGLFVENGRIVDRPDHALRTALRDIAEMHRGELICTANQNVIVANATAAAKRKIDAILRQHGIAVEASSGLRRNSMACVALPSCGLALAESERYLPQLITKLEVLLSEVGLTNDEIVLRMTGCPNGCARPYLAEVGLVGRGPETYNLYLGAAYDGSRLSKLYAEDVQEGAILRLLKVLFGRYARERIQGERFGDYVIRAEIVEPTLQGNRFHEVARLAEAD